MNKLKLLITLLILTLPHLTLAQERPTASSESRDASLVHIGTSNFIIASIANRCAGFIKDGKSSKEFVLEWQERNAKYILAAAFYMERLLAELTPEERPSVFEELTSVSRENGKDVIDALFSQGNQDKTCVQALGMTDGGAFDITPNIDLYKELEELTDWARQQQP